MNNIDIIDNFINMTCPQCLSEELVVIIYPLICNNPTINIQGYIKFDNIILNNYNKNINNINKNINPTLKCRSENKLNTRIKTIHNKCDYEIKLKPDLILYEIKTNIINYEEIIQNYI